MSFTVLVSATSARAPSSNIPHQFRKHSQLITSEALNLPPAPSPSAGTRSPFKGCCSVTRNEFKMHFYEEEANIDLWLAGYNSVFYIFYGSVLWLLFLHCGEFDQASRDQNGIFGGILCVFGGEMRFVGVFTHPNWRESAKAGARNVFAAFSECHIHHCCRLQPCFYLFLSMLSHYSSRFQANLWSWGSPWSRCVWNKMKGIMFILILPNRHCSLVEYTVNVVHGL